MPRVQNLQNRHYAAGKPGGQPGCRLPASAVLVFALLLTAPLPSAGEIAEDAAGETQLTRAEQKQVQLGQQAHQQIIATHGIYRNTELQLYVQRIGERLAAVSNNSRFDYTFTVLNDPMVNAFALPGGYIYITRGMLAHLNSEAELAAVLGHEIAHVTERHATRAKNRGSLLNLLGAAGAVISGVPGVYEAADIASNIYLKGYSRKFELDADKTGAEYMAKAGYSPSAMLGTIDMLKANDRIEIARARVENREPRIYHGFLSTHPDHDTRYREAIEAADSLVGSVQAILTEDQFLEKLNGLAYGVTRRVGVLRRDTFYYPRLGFKLTVPDSWSQQQAQVGALFMSPARDAALAISSLPKSPGKTLEAMLLDRGFRLREGREITIAGSPAWLGTADQGVSPFGTRPLRLALILDRPRGLTYLLQGSGKLDLRSLSADRSFIASIFSFDRMSRADFDLARVPVLQTVRAEPGITWADLAAESPLPNYQETTLRQLNGQYPHGEPGPGQLIKIIQ